MTIEDIKNICKIYDNFRRERDTATIAYNSDDTFYEHILATYKLSQSLFPSNLDEAANRQAALEQPYKWEVEQDGSFGVTPLFVMSNIRSAFKAGAEWMAGQGVILNLSIDEFSCGAYNACVEQGLTSEDEVIVQIRKK